MHERPSVSGGFGVAAILSGGLLFLVIVAAHWLPGPGVVADLPSPTANYSSTGSSGSPETVDNSTQDRGEPTATGIGFPDEQADAIELELEDQDGLIGVVLIDEQGDTIYARNATVPFLSASLYKVVLLADILAGVEEGVLSNSSGVELLAEYFPVEGEFEDSYYPDTSIGAIVPLDELLFATGAYSSNVAAQALRSLTSVDNLDTMAESLGMTGTLFFTDLKSEAAWPPDKPDGVSVDEFAQAITTIETAAVEDVISVTTPSDVSRFFEQLLTGDVYSDEVSQSIVDILTEQVVVDRIPALLPIDTEVAHKTGNLDHVVHDAGIIWTPDGPVILVVMIENAEDDLIATGIIQRIALIAYGEPVQIDIDAATL